MLSTPEDHTRRGPLHKLTMTTQRPRDHPVVYDQRRPWRLLSIKQLCAFYHAHLSSPTNDLQVCVSVHIKLTVGAVRSPRHTQTTQDKFMFSTSTQHTSCEQHVSVCTQRFRYIFLSDDEDKK